MSITLGAFMTFNATPTNVTIDGRVTIDPDTASIVRVTVLNDPTNSWLSGIAGGVDGRLLFLINASGATLQVAHEYDAEASVALPANRLRMETGTYSLLNNAAKVLIYTGTYWRFVGS